MVDEPILLLDLDGVLVTETSEDEHGSRELIVLHDDLGGKLSSASHETYIVTHRSRREAHQILRAASIGRDEIVDVITAETLLQAAMQQGMFWRAVRLGLLKSFALPVIAKKSGRDAGSVVMLDDRQHNLDALIDAGAGLAMKAPFECNANVEHGVTSFDFEHTLGELKTWWANRRGERQIDIEPVEKRHSELMRSGLSTSSLESHAFNQARSLVYRTRKSLKRRD